MWAELHLLLSTRTRFLGCSAKCFGPTSAQNFRRCASLRLPPCVQTAGYCFSLWPLSSDSKEVMSCNFTYSCAHALAWGCPTHCNAAAPAWLFPGDVLPLWIDLALSCAACLFRRIGGNRSWQSCVKLPQRTCLGSFFRRFCCFWRSISQ